MSAIYRSAEAEAEVRAAYRRALDAWLVPHDEQRTQTDEGETFVVSCGDPAAPPLVLLHGAQSNAAAFMFDAMAWSQRFRIHAIDMIGETGFSAPSRPPLHTDAYARWLDQVLDGLSVARAAFVGVSLGGWLALDYATRRPERVDRLALNVPAGIGRQKNFLLRAAPLLLLGAYGRRRVRELVFGPSQGEPPAIARPLVELMETIGRSARPRPVKIPLLTDDQLRALRPPLWIALAGKDALIDSAHARKRLAALKPEAEVAFYPDGYHLLPPQSEPMLAFLTAARRASP